MLQRLTSLARAVALDTDLTVGIGPSWRFHTLERRIELPADDLQLLHEDEVLGLVCHEAAHAALTRYPFLVPRTQLDDPRVAVVLNALEDCRIENWMMQRLPGTRPWIHRFNQRLFPLDGSGLDGLPPVLQYALGAIHHGWHGELPPRLPPAVVQALRHTAAARRAITHTLPDKQHRNIQLEQLFRRIEGERKVGRFEQQVRCAAAQAWQITRDQILPVALALGALSPEQRTPIQRFVQRTGVQYDQPPHLSAMLQLPDPAGRRAVLTPRREGWTAVRAEMLPAIRSLTRLLERQLAPDRAPRWRGAQSTGQRVDLSALMQREARPDTLGIWSVKTVPRRRDHRFLLLLDLSGSMRGERIHWAMRGMVLLAETLERLSIRFAIEGFQDRAFVLKRFDEPLAAATARLMECPQEIAGVRSGGNNHPAHNHDGPALLQASERLLLEGGRTPVLIVVSDGEPSGPEQAGAVLTKAIEAVGQQVQLIGLGLGPGTEHVARFYPNHAAEVAVERFPMVIATTLAGAMR